MYKKEIDKKPTRAEMIEYMNKEGITPPTVPHGKKRLTREMRKRNAKLRDMRESQITGVEDIDRILELKDVPKSDTTYQSYREQKETERLKVKVEQSVETLIFFKRVLKYCEGNGMKPSFTMEGDDINKEFDKLTTKQLFEVGHLLKFAHNAIDNDPKRRYIVTVPEHELAGLVKNQCRIRIPAYDERLKLENLEKTQSDIEKRKQDLQQSIILKQEKYDANRKKVSEPIPTPTPNEEDEYKKCPCGASLKTINESHLNSKRHLEWVREEAKRKEGEQK